MTAAPVNEIGGHQRQEGVMQRYGDWEAVRELGRGGQGTVYLARHLKTEKVHIGGGFIEGTTAAVLDATRRILDVAGRSVFDAADANPANVSKCDAAVAHLLDVLNKTLTAPTLGALKTRTDRNEASPRRFEREIQFLRANPGPEMLRVLDSAPDNSWYVSELHVAGSLDVAWRSGGPCRGSLDAAWRLLRPIAVTLGRLNQKGEVHRDVKAKNVFLANDGRLVLGDPGLALAPTDARLTETHENAASWQWAPCG